MNSLSAMITGKQSELLQFGTIRELVAQRCAGAAARRLCESIRPSPDRSEMLPALLRVAELKNLLSGRGYFPPVDHDDIAQELATLSISGAVLDELRLLRVMNTVSAANRVIRFLHEKKTILPHLSKLAATVQPQPEAATEIERVVDADGTVRSSASAELAQIRRQIVEKRRESDRLFYRRVVELRKLGYLRENEEGFFSGRRTLAVVSDFKSQVPGFVHDKSESGKTVFIEPGDTISVNNEVAELEIDERREINRILRTLCELLHPLSPELKKGQDLLVEVDFHRAKALFAMAINAVIPEIRDDYTLSIRQGYHPLLLLQNTRSAKTTVPLTLTLNDGERIMVISGPNAGGKTIALKTVALLQLMLQSGLLVPVREDSEFPFFSSILIDIGDTQSIENELSTYSAKLKAMTVILERADASSLVLMDEFGSGTDPELGGAIAEAVLESLVNSQARGIITSHFGNIKVLAEKLDGSVNASMLFDAVSFEPKYILSAGEPGSSYTFEVAERTGFPKYLIERARKKVDSEKLSLGRLLSDVQTQKSKLEDALRKAERESSGSRAAREKYQALFDTWQEKMDRDREKHAELVRLAEYGRKYQRLMDDWNEKKDRKAVIKRFIDGITAETRKKEAQRKDLKRDARAEKKIARIRSEVHVGSRVKVLNAKEFGVVEAIRNDKVQIRVGLLKMTVGMENIALAGDVQD